MKVLDETRNKHFMNYSAILDDVSTANICRFMNAFLYVLNVNFKEVFLKNVENILEDNSLRFFLRTVTFQDNGLVSFQEDRKVFFKGIFIILNYNFNFIFLACIFIIIKKVLKNKDNFRFIINFKVNITWCIINLNYSFEVFYEDAELFSIGDRLDIQRFTNFFIFIIEEKEVSVKIVKGIVKKVKNEDNLDVPFFQASVNLQVNVTDYMELILVLLVYYKDNFKVVTFNVEVWFSLVPVLKNKILSFRSGGCLKKYFFGGIEWLKECRLLFLHKNVKGKVVIDRPTFPY